MKTTLLRRARPGRTELREPSLLAKIVSGDSGFALGNFGHCPPPGHLHAPFNERLGGPQPHSSNFPASLHASRFNSANFGFAVGQAAATSDRIFADRSLRTLIRFSKQNALSAAPSRPDAPTSEFEPDWCSSWRTPLRARTLSASRPPSTGRAKRSGRISPGLSCKPASFRAVTTQLLVASFRPEAGGEFSHGRASVRTGGSGAASTGA